MKTSTPFKKIFFLLLIANYCSGQIQLSNQKNFSDITLVNVETKVEIFKGEAAIYGKKKNAEKGSSLILINDVLLSSGVIEFDLAGSRASDSHPQNRGFLGLAFRISEDNSNFDCFYLRAANGRADTQLQRNHTVQYFSNPDFQWPLLRKETPGKYETYVDITPLEWTHVKIIVEGNRAEIYVHKATQPTMVVEQLLGTEKSGKIALWIGPGTDAYFANLQVTTTK